MILTTPRIPGPPGADGTPATGRLYYLQDVLSTDIALYNQLTLTPAAGLEQDDTAVVNSGSGEVLLDQYATEAGDPAVLSIPAGLWEFDFWRWVSNQAGVTQIRFRVYKRDLAHTETELFNILSGDIQDTSITEQDLQYTTIAATPVLATDRLVVKVYALTTSGVNRTVHFIHDGSLHASHFHCPI